MQLEFSLLALRDDPLPTLRAELSAAQASGDAAREADLAQRLADEHAKRGRWAVRYFSPLLSYAIALTHTVNPEVREWSPPP